MKSTAAMITRGYQLARVVRDFGGDVSQVSVEFGQDRSAAALEEQTYLLAWLRSSLNGPLAWFQWVSMSS